MIFPFERYAPIADRFPEQPDLSGPKIKRLDNETFRSILRPIADDNHEVPATERPNSAPAA
jgi:hypothetical protein